MPARTAMGLLLLMAALGGCGGSPAAPAQPTDPHEVHLGQFEETADRPDTTVPLSEVRILDSILRPSENWRIHPRAGINTYYYVFTVRTPTGGEHQVTSVRELVQLCREIDVLAHMRDTENNETAIALRQSASGIGQGAKNLVLHPARSLMTIGSGIGRFGRATGRALTSPFRDEKNRLASDGTDRGWFGKGPAGGERRRVAWEMGLDVYTRNPDAQALIQEIARQRFAAKLPVAAGLFALPGGSLFLFSLTPMGFDPSTEEMIRDNAPDDLKLLLAEHYLDQFGLDYGDREDPVQDLLDNPNFSPREQAYIWRYLTDLQGATHVRDAVAFLGAQDSVERAGIVTAQLELLSLLHMRHPQRRLVRFVPVRNTLGALTEDGTLCLVISIDTVRFWSDVRTSLEISLTAARETGASRIEIWSTGDVDEQSVQLAGRYGVKVYQNILEQEMFRRPREEAADVLAPAAPQAGPPEPGDTPAEALKAVPGASLEPGNPAGLGQKKTERAPSMVESYW